MKYTKIKEHMIFYAYRKLHEQSQEETAGILDCTLREYQIFERYGVAKDLTFAENIKLTTENYKLSDKDLLRIWLKYFNNNLKEAARKLKISTTKAVAMTKGYCPKDANEIFDFIKQEMR